MRSWKISPKEAAISKYIDCYWLLEKSSADIGVDFPKLNPDPAGHLIISQEQQPFSYTYEGRQASGLGSHLMLPHDKTLTMDHCQPFLVLGVKFHVGALYTLNLYEKGPLLNDIVAIDLCQDLQVAAGDSHLLMSLPVDDAQGYRDRLDKLLKPLINQAHEDNHSRLVHKVLAIYSSVPLAKLGKELGCSQRTIERSFLKVTGTSLKQYYSMQRLEDMLDYVTQHMKTSIDPKSINWADVALQFDFSDQPHLIRYLKSTIGATPGKYSDDRDLAIDVYGNFE